MRSAGAILALIFSAFAAPFLFGEPVTYTGALVALNPRTIWIKQANGIVVYARLPETGKLSAGELAGRYKTGDQVALKGVRIETVYDDEDHAWFNIDLKSLEYIRPGSRADFSAAAACPVRRWRVNLLKDPAGSDAPKPNLRSLPLPDESHVEPGKRDDATLLARSRIFVRELLAALPNFTADETRSRYFSPIANPPRWTVNEILESEVVFHGNREEHLHIVRNGHPWTDVYNHVPTGVAAYNPNQLLALLFDPSCGTDFEFSRRTDEGGERVSVYRFTSPTDSCFPGDFQFEVAYFPGHTGEITIAESDASVRRIECSTTGFPKEFPRQLSEDRAYWSLIQIGATRHLLPIRVERLEVKAPTMVLSTRKFRNHRHFEANSTITYQ